MVNDISIGDVEIISVGPTPSAHEDFFPVKNVGEIRVVRNAKQPMPARKNKTGGIKGSQ